MLGRLSHWPSVLCLKYYFFHNFLQNFLQKSFQFIFFVFSFECPKFYFQSIKIILGPSDDWSMKRLTQRPSVLYWRLLDLCTAISYRAYREVPVLKTCSLLWEQDPCNSNRFSLRVKQAFFVRMWAQRIHVFIAVYCLSNYISMVSVGLRCISVRQISFFQHEL